MLVSNVFLFLLPKSNQSTEAKLLVLPCDWKVNAVKDHEHKDFRAASGVMSHSLNVATEAKCV
jgi:hypothetical protein